MLDIYKPLKDDSIKSIKFVSIDPGTKHFAIRIEIISFGDITSYQMILFQLINFEERLKERKEDLNDYNMIIAIENYMQSIKCLLVNTNIVIIEDQMKINKKTLPIFRHLISYFMHSPIYEDTCVIGMSPKFKGKMLGLKGKDIKKCTVDIIINIFKQRNDVESLRILASHEKKDDLCDTKAMIESMCIQLNM